MGGDPIQYSNALLNRDPRALQRLRGQRRLLHLSVRAAGLDREKAHMNPRGAEGRADDALAQGFPRERRPEVGRRVGVRPRSL